MESRCKPRNEPLPFVALNEPVASTPYGRMLQVMELSQRAQRLAKQLKHAQSAFERSG